MGCCSATLRHYMILAADDVYSTRSLVPIMELKVIAESYNDIIVPSIKSDLVRWLDDLLSGVAIIRRAMKKKQRLKLNAYSKIDAELNKLMLFPSYLAPGTLEETMDLQLRLQIDRIPKRKRSIKRWRKVCTAVVMAVVVGMLMVSIGLALAGAAPVAIASAASGATAIKAVEPLVNAVLEEKERKLKEEEEEVVDMMREVGQLINGVRRLTEEIMNKYLDFEKHIKAMKKEAPEMEKMIDEIESNAMELKGKINHYRDQIEQFQKKFTKIIK